MKKLILPLLLLATLTASAQPKKDTTKANPYQPDLKRVYDFHIKGTVFDLQSWYATVQATAIDQSPQLTGAQIQNAKKSAGALLDSLVSQYRKQYLADSLKKAGAR